MFDAEKAAPSRGWFSSALPRLTEWRGRLVQRWRHFRFRDLQRGVVLPKPGALGDGAWRASIGREGERLAARFLRREGMKILYRNFRAPGGGEVDLVCRENMVLVFVEVKTRTSQAYGRPAEAVSKAKQRLIIRGAIEWLRLLGFPEIAFRFDIVEVTLARDRAPNINLIQGAFRMPGDYRY